MRVSYRRAEGGRRRCSSQQSHRQTGSPLPKRPVCQPDGSRRFLGTPWLRSPRTAYGPPMDCPSTVHGAPKGRSAAARVALPLSLASSTLAPFPFPTMQLPLPKLAYSAPTPCTLPLLHPLLQRLLGLFTHCAQKVHAVITTVFNKCRDSGDSRAKYSPSFSQLCTPATQLRYCSLWCVTTDGPGLA